MWTALLLVAAAALTQSERVAIATPSGASLAGVLVRVEGTRVELLTDVSGRFVLTPISPGTRRLLASAPG